MAAPTLLSIFPKPEDLLAVAPEDLAGVIVEVMPPLMQNGLFNPGYLVAQVFQPVGPTYPGTQRPVLRAITEAVSWLITQGILAADLEQPAPGFYFVTRLGQTLRTRADVEAFRKGRILTEELVPAVFAAKVVPLFRRGDYEVAVFQAFKEVEVSVRKAANSKGAGYADSEVGVTLMRKAFHPDTGPLTDKSVIPAEREAEMHLFAGAMGHAKNPTSHRDVVIAARESARLIIFAGYLLDLVERRAS
jgi:uncharacterized protein (TIGR02391 family)